MEPRPGVVPSRRDVLRVGGLALVLGAVGCAPTSDDQETPTGRAGTPAAWRTVCEDTFTDGLDPAVWTAADYGGNRDLGELQYYDPALVSVEHGNLVLRARADPRDGYAYVAGSVSSKGKLTVGPYGRLTTRQLLGPGAGVGFAVALYGQDIDEVGWPACGEIDATEVALARPGAPFASLHGPGYSGGSPISGTGDVPSLVDRWATHTLDWEPERISWAIDGQVYQVAEISDPRAAAGWPFDQPFFLTMVLTVGSTLSGPVDVTTWPRDVTGAPTDPYAAVDLVRFEQRAGT